jgi:hypothetical protein
MDCEADDIQVTVTSGPSLRGLPDFVGGSNVHVDDRGLSVGGQLKFARSHLRSTHLQKLPDGRVAVCFSTSTLSLRATIPDEATARALCEALGTKVSAILPEGATVARHFGFAGTTRHVLAALVAGMLVMAGTELARDVRFTFAVACALMVAAVALAWSALFELTIGVDGVAIRRRGRSRFVSFEDIVSIDSRPEGVAIVLRSTEEILIHVPFAGADAALLRQRDKIAESLTESLRAYGETLLEPDHARVSALAVLARGERPLAEWLVALKDLAAPTGSAYRSAEVPIEELWRVVEDATAEPTARAGAAVALRPTLDDDGRVRLRVASEGTASPKIRVVLEAASGENDAALQTALAEVVEVGDVAKVTEVT